MDDKKLENIENLLKLLLIKTDIILSKMQLDEQFGCGNKTSLWMQEDEMYDEALSVIVEAGKASPSLLQRHLRIGYARAARLMDIFEEKGVVDTGNGTKPRKVLIKKEDLQQEK
jgi:DNA segregation ATPase FtsK/SpoIIIE-like protein